MCKPVSLTFSHPLCSSLDRLYLLVPHVMFLSWLAPPLGMASLPYYELSLCLVFLLHPVTLFGHFFSLAFSTLKAPLHSECDDIHSINVLIREDISSSQCTCFTL